MPRSDDRYSPLYTLLARARLKELAAERREREAAELRQQVAVMRQVHAEAAGTTAVAVRPAAKRR